MLDKSQKLLSKIIIALTISIITSISLMAKNDKIFDVTSPMILEFYTSQSCIDCIDISNVIKNIQSDNILALEFHVDHLDKFGWKDIFALKSATKRQNTYMDNFMQKTTALPYVVVQGIHGTIGSREKLLLNNIKDVEENTLNIDGLLFDARLAGRGEYIDIMLNGRGNIGGEFDLWLISYDSDTKTYIGDGPNRGNTVRGKNVVQDIIKLSDWKGEARSFPIQRRSIKGKDGVVVIIQEQNGGSIITARNVVF